MTPHTPTPWRVENDQIWSVGPLSHQVCGFERPRKYPGNRVDDDAAFIVQAVNSHAAHLAFITHILAMADDAYFMGHPEWQVLIEEARAIALLGEKVAP